MLITAVEEIITSKGLVAKSRGAEAVMKKWI
jgi:hypothetical protein